jgi:hypothetical protein
MDIARYYNVVYDQQFSPSGKYLATGDAYGRIAVFRRHSVILQPREKRLLLE